LATLTNYLHIQFYEFDYNYSFIYKFVFLNLNKITLKGLLKYYLLVVIVVFTSISQQSCKTKEGCGLEEKYNNPDMESTKRGKSKLFPNSKRKN